MHTHPSPPLSGPVAWESRRADWQFQSALARSSAPAPAGPAGPAGTAPAPAGPAPRHQTASAQVVCSRLTRPFLRSDSGRTSWSLLLTSSWPGSAQGHKRSSALSLSGQLRAVSKEVPADFQHHVPPSPPIPCPDTSPVYIYLRYVLHHKNGPLSLRAARNLPHKTLLTAPLPFFPQSWPARLPDRQFLARHSFAPSLAHPLCCLHAPSPTRLTLPSSSPSAALTCARSDTRLDSYSLPLQSIPTLVVDAC